MTPSRRILGLLRRNAITRSVILPILHGARWRMNPRYFRIYEKYRTFTMISSDRFADNLWLCQKLVNQSGLVVECGVWRGGMSAGMAEVLGPARIYYLFDSFEGLPSADPELDGKAAIGWQADTTSPHYFNNCRAEISFAETAMQRSGVPDYRLVKGWYKDTLRAFKPPASIAVLRLDCDWYEPTTQCLEALYQHLLPGGLLLLDDYYTWDGCVRAVQDFLARASLPERIRQSPHGIAYIVKGTSYFVKDQASYL